MNRVFRIVNEKVKQNALNEIKYLPNGKFEIVIRPIGRSLAQNDYYWALIKVLSDEKGDDPEWLHQAFKRNYIGQEQGVDMFGNVYIVAKSSKKLSKADFQEYITKVQVYIESEGLTVPTRSYFGG